MPSSLAMLFLVLRLADDTPRIAEFVDVTSYGPGRLSSPAAVTRLEFADFERSPAATLDDTLRSVPGFSLFRRSSSRVANPTTQGVTLRGLAASGASRAVVLADDIPVNDPFGGWVYWNRIPAAAIGQVDVVRGAAGDLFGPDAVGGSVLIRTNGAPGFRLLADGGTDATARVSLSAGAHVQETTLMLAAEQFTTDGFVIVAPESRGPIDTPAASKHWSAHATVMTPGRFRTTGELRGSYFSEQRENGTPFQVNSTVIRQASGLVKDTSGWLGRAYFVSQDYDQTFSAVLPGRAAERPTSRQHVDAQTFGGGVEWHRALGAGGLMLAGSGRRIETTLDDEPIPAPAAPTVTDANQWTAGGSAVLTFQPKPRVTLAGGLRVEAWRTSLDDGDASRAGVVLVMPRASVVFAASDRLSLRAAFQNADRNPTLNELYRPFRVGNVQTLANPALVPETVAGFEGSAVWTKFRRLTVRGLAFWTDVDNAIVNVTLSAPGAPTIVRQRQNASHIRARGAEGEVEWRPVEVLAFTAAGALTDSKFTEADLDGLWVPQVARSQIALGARGNWARFRAGGEWRYIGRQYDDDRNEFPLNRASTFDGRIGWRAVQSVEVFAALENAFDEEMDVGRTPIRTIGLPRTFRAGVRITR